MTAPHRPLTCLALAVLVLGPIACSDSSPDTSGDDLIDETGDDAGNYDESNPVPGFDQIGGTWQMTECHIEWDTLVTYDNGDTVERFATSSCESPDNQVTFDADGSYTVAGYVNRYNTSSSSSSPEISTSTDQYDFIQTSVTSAHHWFIDGADFYFGFSDQLFLSAFGIQRCDQPDQTLHVFENDVTRYHRMDLFSVDGSAFTVRTSNTNCRIGVDGGLDSETDVTASFTFTRVE